MAAFIFSLLHQFLLDCGCLNSHNVPQPAIVQLLHGYHGSAIMEHQLWGALIHMHPGAPVTAHHSPQLS